MLKCIYVLFQINERPLRSKYFVAHHSCVYIHTFPAFFHRAKRRFTAILDYNEQKIYKVY